jgi:hypothetical protein
VIHLPQFEKPCSKINCLNNFSITALCLICDGDNDKSIPYLFSCW